MHGGGIKLKQEALFRIEYLLPDKIFCFINGRSLCETYNCGNCGKHGCVKGGEEMHGIAKISFKYMANPASPKHLYDNLLVMMPWFSSTKFGVGGAELHQIARSFGVTCPLIVHVCG